MITVIGIGPSAEKALEASIDDLGPRTYQYFKSIEKSSGVSQGFNPLKIKKDGEVLAENTEHNWMIAPATMVIAKLNIEIQIL